MILYLAALSLLSFVAPVLLAQDPQGPGAAAVAELRAIVAKKVAPAEQAARNDEVAAWLEKHASADLKEHGWMRSLARYYARDVEGACSGMLAWIDERGALPKDPDFDPITGRIFLGAAVQSATAAAWERYDRCCALALELYPEKATIYRALLGSLARAETAEAFARSKALLSSMLLDEALDDGARLEVLRAALRVQAPKAALKPFKKRTMDGQEVALEDWKGEVVLVDFWATWCQPCIKELPHVVELYEKHRGEGLRILGISLDRPKAEAKIAETAEKLGMGWPQIYDGGHWDAELAKANGVRSIPATYLYDRKGKLRYTSLKGEELGKRVRELLAESK